LTRITASRCNETMCRHVAAPLRAMEQPRAGAVCRYGAIRTGNPVRIATI
jgi:hypothetical protein